jgi:hypothetical protein
MCCGISLTLKARVIATGDLAAVKVVKVEPGKILTLALL